MTDIGTFSIVVGCPDSMEWGVGVASRYLAVGAIVPWAEACAGALATQAKGLRGHWEIGGRLLREGASADEVLQGILAGDKDAESRQIGVVDARGNAASCTGIRCLPHAASIVRGYYALQGNLIEPGVLEAMDETFQQQRATAVPLPEAIVATLQSGQNAGGDRRGRQAAALMVSKRDPHGELTESRVDLRVDDHPAPLSKLENLLGLYRIMHDTDRDPFMVAVWDVQSDIAHLLTQYGITQTETPERAMEGFLESLNLSCALRGPLLDRRVFDILLHRRDLKN